MLGAKLKKLRKGKKLTLQALADKAETTKNYLWELENRPSNPCAKLLYKIATTLNVTMEFLIADVKNKTTFDDIFLKSYNKLKLSDKKRLYKIMIALTK